MAWVLIAAVGCGRVGAPRTITDHMEGWWSDDAGGTDETPCSAAAAAGPGAMRMFARNAKGPSGVSASADEVDEVDEVDVFDEPEPLPGSRRLLEPATVLAAPRVDAPMLATIVAGTRIAVLGPADATGCATGWWAVAPDGFVCARSEASERAPTDTMLPRLPRGAIVPGVYGKVSADAEIYPTRDAAARGVGGARPSRSLTVHRLARVSLGGRRFWRTQQGYIPEAQIRRHRGSRFAGVRLDKAEAPALPFAWVSARPGSDRTSVPVRAAARASARVVDRLPRRTIVAVGERERGFVRVEAGWIALADLRVADVAPPPEGLRAGERWIDIDLGQQVLVAYEGTTPVYATMVSSGRAGHRTPTGVYRIERKVAERTMNSMSDSDEEYSVAKVPWTAYFSKGYALHASYWHDGFGRPRSHGCINLSPRDARELYGFAAPDARPGYAEIFGHEAQPGSVVRVRSGRDPEPALKGYARALAEDGEAQMLARADADPNARINPRG